MLHKNITSAIIAAAYEVARILRIKKKIIEKAVKKFKGLHHRLEKVAEIDEVIYYDDSFATAPEASIVALRSFPRVIARKQTHSNKKIILLAGGTDKGSSFKEFVREMNKRVKYLILFKGKGTDRILEEIKNLKLEIGNSIVDSMEEAMSIAKRKVKPGDVVLLSAGCASFGVFKNYKERGEQFKEEIKKNK